MYNFKFLKSVITLSITSFGGPAGHLLAFIDLFVEKNSYFSKEEVLNLHSYCSILPGATSTQLLCLLAYRKGGIILACISLLIWIFPVSLTMFFISYILSSHNLITSTESLFIFFQPMIIAFMLSAAFKLQHTHYQHGNQKFLLLLNLIILLVFFKHPFILPFCFLINGMLSYKTNSIELKLSYNTLKNLRINRRLFYFFILTFLISGLLSEYSRKFETKNRYIFNIIEHNFRHGSMVYGGGDVLIPIMYEQYVSRPSAPSIKRRNPEVLSLEKDELLAGAGIIRLMPGPVFAIVSFTTPLLVKEYPLTQKIATTILATLSIFLPGALIVLTLYPVWQALSYNNSFSIFLKGINLTVLSILISSSVYFLLDMTIHSDNILLYAFQLCTLFIVFYLVTIKKTNHSYIATIFFLAGILYHFL